MKVKKAYLYSAIAIVLVLASLFFTIFGNSGKAYNYAKKNLDKFVSGLVYENIDITGIEWEQIAADKSDVNARIAKLLKAAAMSKNSNKLPSATKGTIDDYDVVVFNYYGVYTDADGKEVIFTAGSAMNPNLGTDFQIFANAEGNNKLFNEDLNKLFSDALNHKNIADFSYNTQTSGYLHANDVVFISYTTTESGATKKPYVRINLADGKDAVDAVYGAGFYDKLLETPIGQEQKASETAPLTFGEKSYSAFVVDWAVRDTFGKASESFKEGDIVFAIVTTKDSSNKNVEFAVRLNKTADGYTYVAYNLTRGELVKEDSTTKLPEEVLNRIAKSVVNGSGTVEYAPATDAEAKWNEGDHYIYIESSYALVNKEEVTAPKSDVSYYTKDADGKYVKCESTLTEWAADTDYYTFVAATYKKVDKTNGTYNGETQYYVYLGSYTYNVKSVVRAGAEATDVKDAFKGITITYHYGEDATEKGQDGTELKNKDVTYYVYATGVRKILTSYSNISSISGDFNSDNATKLKAIKTALTSYDSALKSVNDLFGTDNKALVEAYVAAFKAYRADNADANKTAYEAAHKALVDLVIKDKTEANKKDALSKFETAYDTLQNAVVDYYANKVAADVVNADKAYTEAKAALTALFGEANAEAVNAYVDAFVAYRADAENEEAKKAYDDAKAALVAATVEGKEEADKTAAISDFEAASDARGEVISASYSNVDKAVEVSAALVAAKEALSVFDDEDLVKAFVSAFIAYKADSSDTKKTTYENAKEALLAVEVDGKDAAAKEALVKAYEDAFVAFQAETKTASVHVVETWLDKEAFEVLLVEAEDDLKVEYKNNYINEVVELLWEEIFKTAKFNKLPAKALRNAIKDQKDSYKKTYYSSEYKNYDTFKDYMKNKAFKDADDWKAALEEDAADMVKEHLVIFQLADMLNIDVSEKAITEDDVYSYSYMSLPEQVQTAYAFDMVFSHLLDVVYADDMKTPRN